MAQSFDGVNLNTSGSIINFGATRPADTQDIPIVIINSNSRTTAIVIKDGGNSAPFAGVYTILTGGISEYNLIKAKVGTTGTLIDGSETYLNITLKAVGRAQNLGAGALRCALSFEFMG